MLSLKDKDNYEWNLETPSSDDQQITWSIAKKAIEIPEAEEDLVYTGDALTGVKLPENAGEHTAVAVLNDKDNYNWKDKGSADDQEISWSIAKRNVTLWSETKFKDYDGTALTAPNVYADSEKNASRQRICRRGK